MPEFVFSKKTGLYRYKSNGHAVPQSRVSGWIDDVSKSMASNLEAIANDLREKKINDAEWALRSIEEIKNGHRAVAMIAAGGKGNMAASDWGFVGGTVRRELTYFNGFASEIDNRPADAELTDAFVSRAKSYGASIYSTYQQALRRRIGRDATAKFETNILEPGAQHCQGCLEETGRGTVAFGTLVPVGDRNCGTRCRCHIEYSTTAPAQAGASANA
jgi:hypothetical protein